MDNKEDEKKYYKLLNEVINLGIDIGRIKDLFIRGIFSQYNNGRYCFFVKGDYFSYSEMEYLFILFDCLHNLSEFLQRCLNIMEGKNLPRSFSTVYFLHEFEMLKKFINDEKYVEECNIKVNNRIRGWMHDLLRMNCYIDFIVEKLKADNFPPMI